jgi:hypothetical protein
MYQKYACFHNLKFGGISHSICYYIFSYIPTFIHKDIHTFICGGSTVVSSLLR